MVGTVILVILFIITVLLLLPVRLKASFGDGKWSVAAYYVCIRVFHKESQEKPKPELPPKPDDLSEDDALPQSKPPETSQKPEPLPDAVPKPDTVTAKPEQSAPKPEDDAGEPLNVEEIADNTELKPLKKKKKPKKKRKEKPESEPPAEDADEKKDEKPKKRGFIERLKPHSLSDIIGLADDGLAALSPALAFLMKHLHFRHIRLYLAVGTDDPANTATLYGKICAAAYNLLGALQSRVDFQADEFRILADFYSGSMTFRASGELRVSPMAAILLVLILGIRFLWRTLLRFRREDKEAKCRAEESAPQPAAASGT